MRAVRLDEIEAQSLGAACRLDEGALHAREIGAGRLLRRLPTVVERNGRGCQRRPAILLRLQRAAALPGPLRRCLAARVSELDADRRVAEAPARREYVREGELVAVGVEPETSMCDPARPLDRRRLDHQQAGAGNCKAAEMHHVPIGRTAIVRAVLAHGCHHDAVRQREAAHGDWRKELARHSRSLAG